jgi:hypothetical protein
MNSAPQTRVVYQSETLLARWIGGYSNRICAVTFAALDEQIGVDRPGFGEDFFPRLGVDAIHIVPLGNHWYQYPDLPAMCAAVREAVAGYERVITYGSSMGAYAAIRFGGWVGAHAALALSPQFSVAVRPGPLGFGLRDFVRHDRRWRIRGRTLSFPYEQQSDFVRHAVIVYDPLTQDREHAEHYAAAAADVTLVPLPYSGHPSGVVLTQSGLLTPLISDVLNGVFDADRFREEAERLSQATPQFHIERALHAKSRRERRRLAQATNDAFPGNPSALRLLARTALALNDFNAAADAAQALLAIEPQFQDNQFLLAQAHARAGRLNAAIAILERLVQTPDHPMKYERRLATLRRLRRWRDFVWPFSER